MLLFLHLHPQLTELLGLLVLLLLVVENLLVDIVSLLFLFLELLVDFNVLLQGMVLLAGVQVVNLKAGVEEKGCVLLFHQSSLLLFRINLQLLLAIKVFLLLVSLPDMRQLLQFLLSLLLFGLLLLVQGDPNLFRPIDKMGSLPH